MGVPTNLFSKKLPKAVTSTQVTSKQLLSYPKELWDRVDLSLHDEEAGSVFNIINENIKAMKKQVYRVNLVFQKKQHNFFLDDCLEKKYNVDRETVKCVFRSSSPPKKTEIKNVKIQVHIQIPRKDTISLHRIVIIIGSLMFFLLLPKTKSNPTRKRLLNTDEIVLITDYKVNHWRKTSERLKS